MTEGLTEFDEGVIAAHSEVLREQLKEMVRADDFEASARRWRAASWVLLVAFLVAAVFAVAGWWMAWDAMVRP